MLSNTFKCYQTYVWHHILKKAFQLLKQRLKEVSLSLSLSLNSRAETIVPCLITWGSKGGELHGF